MSVTNDPDTIIGQLRFALNDRDLSSPLAQDEDYESALRVTNGDMRAAELKMAEAFALRFSTMPTQVTSEGETVIWEDRLRGWNAKVATLRAGGYGASPLKSGNLSRSHKKIKTEYR